MKNEIDDITIELELLASNADQDFNNKFWGNYEQYLNQYNTLLLKLKVIGLFRDYQQIIKVPKEQKTGYGVIGTQAEQAKLREITNSSHILVQKMKQKYQKNIFRNPVNRTKIINSIYNFLHENKLITIAITCIFLIAAYYTISDHFDNQNEVNLKPLHKIEVTNDDKIIFRAEDSEKIWNYNAFFNVNFNLWSENPGVLNVYYKNFTKLNNTVQEDYMTKTIDNMDYEVYPENKYLHYNIEPDDRNKNVSIKFYLENFKISGNYTLVDASEESSPELNFYLGEVTILINFKDLKTNEEINNTINIPVYWINEVFNR